MKTRTDAINRLLDSLEHWFNEDPAAISTSALAHDSDDETFADLIGAALTERECNRMHEANMRRRTERMNARRAA